MKTFIKFDDFSIVHDQQYFLPLQNKSKNLLGACFLYFNNDLQYMHSTKKIKYKEFVKFKYFMQTIKINQRNDVWKKYSYQTFFKNYAIK